MKSKEGILIISFLIILVLGVGGFIIYKNIEKTKNDKIGTEYTPQEEISEEQMRQTIITLYYQNKETKDIMPEARKIDVNMLSKDPYLYLLNCLIQGPKSDKLERLIPEGTKVNKVELNGEILMVDFSKEFIENAKEGKEEEEKVIKSIVNTVTELTEVNAVHILIDGEDQKAFKDNAVNFKNNFARED